MVRVRKHATFSNVLASVALFVALGGTSYAVASGGIGSREIRNNAVRSVDIRNGAIAGKDVAAGTLGSREITGLTADDFAGGLPAGTPGTKGETGEKGDKGDKGDACSPSDLACKGPKGDAGEPATISPSSGLETGVDGDPGGCGSGTGFNLPASDKQRLVLYTAQITRGFADPVDYKVTVGAVTDVKRVADTNATTMSGQVVVPPTPSNTFIGVNAALVSSCSGKLGHIALRFSIVEYAPPPPAPTPGPED